MNDDTCTAFVTKRHEYDKMWSAKVKIEIWGSIERRYNHYICDKNRAWIRWKNDVTKVEIENQYDCDKL